jgi:TP901 family phage tail tape measure protein
MADTIGSKLGFDANDAISAILRLKKALDNYNAALEKIAGGSQGFNSAQTKVDDILKRLATSSELAAGQLKSLAASQDKAAASATNLAVKQEEAAKSIRKSSAAATSEERAEEALRNKALSGVRQRFDTEKRSLDLLAKQRVQAAQTPFQQALGIDPNQKAQLSGDVLFRASQQKNAQQLRATEDALRSVAGRASATGDELEKGAAKGAAGANSLELSWRSVIRVFGIQFAAQAVSSLVNAFVEGVRSAREFEISLAEIQTISKEFQQTGIESVAAAVTGIAEEFGRPIEDVAKGLYQTLSNQIGNATESVRFLGQAAEFSVATVTSLSESVDLLSGVLNAYGLTAASTQRISDVLFKTIELGRVTGEELNGSIGRITTSSAQLGISFEEVASAMATLTIQGVKASDAATQILNVELKLIKPTDNLKAVYRELGIASGEAGIALFGLQGFLEKITEVGGESATEIAALFNQIRGTRGVIGLTGEAVKKANENLIEITKSAGATKKAFDLINQTNAQQLTKQLEGLRAVLVNDIGRSAISVFLTLTNAIGGVKVAMGALAAAIGLVISGALLIFLSQTLKAVVSLGFATDATASKMLLLSGALTLALPIAAGAAVISMLKIKDATRDAEKTIVDLQKAADIRIKLKLESALPEIKKEQEAIKENTRLIIESLAARIRAIDEERIRNILSNEEVTKSLAENVGHRKDILKDGIDALNKLIDDTKNRSKNAADTVKALLKDLAEGRFERAVTGGTFRQEAADRQSRINNLLAEALFLAKGDADQQKRSLELLADAKTQAEKILAIGQNSVHNEEERRKAAAIRLQGEQAINQVGRAGIAIQREQIKANKEQADALQKTKDKEETLLHSREKAEKVQTDISTTGDEIAKGVENATNNMITFGEQATVAKAKVDASFAALVTNLTQIKSRVGPTFAENLATAAGAEPLADPKEIVQKQIENVLALRPKIQKAIQEGDLQALAGFQKQLEGQSELLRQQITERGLGEKISNGIFGGTPEALLKSIDLLGREMADAAVAQGKLNQASAVKTDLSGKVEALGKLGQAAKDNKDPIAGMGAALATLGASSNLTGVGLDLIGKASGPAIAGLQGVQNVVNTFSTSNIVLEVQKALVALQELAAAQAASGGGGTAALALGGLVRRFAIGGFAPRGTDTVPAMLTPGEFVVNARDSKRFFSELVAINSGRRPIFRQDGGAVSQSFGDININVPDGRGPVDARELAKELRRQLRRKTARL